MIISPRINYVYYFMKKEKSIFVTEGYLLRDVIAIKFLIERNWGNKKCFVMWNCTAHVKSIGHSLNVLYCKRKKSVFIIKKRSFDISNRNHGLQLSRLFMFVDFAGVAVDLTRTELSTMSVQMDGREGKP